MAELIKASESIDRWMSEVVSVQQQRDAAIAQNNDLLSVIAEAASRRFMMQSMNDKQVAAELASWSEPDIGLVKVEAGSADEKSRVRITAMAILAGFRPGRDEFSIWGGRAPSLYIKEQGYRRLFARLPGCSSPDVQEGFPSLLTMDNDRKIWLTDGTAACKYNGETHTIMASGEYAIGIPATISKQDGQVVDNIDGIRAKVRRRLLQLLWKKVCTLSIEDLDETHGDDEPAGSVRVIEQQSQPASDDPWAEEKAHLQSPRAQAAWDKLAEAKGEAEIDSLMKHAAKVDMHTKDRQSLQRFADFLTGKAS